MAKNSSRASTASLLVELLTEELPPKSLANLSRVFADEIGNGLVRNELKQDAGGWKAFCTPRRLAVLIPGVRNAGEDRSTEVTGPSVKAPPEAVAGFARKQGVEVKDLQTRDTPKGPVYLARVTLKGVTLTDHKTGGMDNKIHERRLAGDKSPELAALLKTKSTSFPVELKADD